MFATTFVQSVSTQSSLDGPARKNMEKTDRVYTETIRLKSTEGGRLIGIIRLWTYYSTIRPTLVT